MIEDKTIIYVALIIAIVSLMFSGVIALWAFTYEPEQTDLSGIESSIKILNSNDIALTAELAKLKTNQTAQISSTRFNDLEDDVTSVTDIIMELEDCAEDEDLTDDEFIECIRKELD